jgi:hypothetical protein
MDMIPTEPIGSIPRPRHLIDEIADRGDHEHPRLNPLYQEAIQDTIMRFEATGYPLLRTGNKGNTITFGRTVSTAFQILRRMVSKFHSPPAMLGACLV